MTAQGRGAQADGRFGLAYLTSCRELAYAERAGQTVSGPEGHFGYRASLLEQIAHGLNGQDDVLSAFELRRILVDDGPEELDALRRACPVWPEALTVPGQNRPETLQSLTRQVSSADYRSLRKAAAESGSEFAQRRAQAKQAYERTLLKACRDDIALLICDSYTLLLGETFLSGFAGLILNVHPAITQLDDAARLPGRTPTRDAYTRAAFGYIIVDDKRLTPLPEGQALMVDYQGEQRKAVAVTPLYRSGVSVHVLTAELDAGPVVASCHYRFAREGLSLERLRAISYALKPLVLRQALQTYLAGQVPTRF